MGTLTAQLLVGRTHPNHGGIIPTHHLFLTENSHPVWTLVAENVYDSNRREEKPTVWIPTVENMLEDAMVMIGLYVLKDPSLIEIDRELGLTEKTSLEMYRDVDSESREKLYEATRQIQTRYKVTLSVFEGSTLLTQLAAFERYSMDVEVCTPQFRREYSSWTEKTHVMGNLSNHRMEA